MTSKKRQFGDLGEEIVAKWLRGRGFEILERNYLKKWGEIDIVAKKDKTLFFVEVKTVSVKSLSNDYLENLSFRPEENVHRWKLERLSRTLNTYLAEKKWKGDLSAQAEWQISVAVVYLNKETKQAKVKFLENII